MRSNLRSNSSNLASGEIGPLGSISRTFPPRRSRETAPLYHVVVLNATPIGPERTMCPSRAPPVKTHVIRFAVVAVISVSLLFPQAAGASQEWVYVKRVIDDGALVVRRNGDAYSIKTGIGCLSLWRYEGKTVLIRSPGLFLGVGSELSVPDLQRVVAFGARSALVRRCPPPAPAPRSHIG
jgi:hypothetical protein